MQELGKNASVGKFRMAQEVMGSILASNIELLEAVLVSKMTSEPRYVFILEIYVTNYICVCYFARHITIISEKTEKRWHPWWESNPGPPVQSEISPLKHQLSCVLTTQIQYMDSDSEYMPSRYFCCKNVTSG